MNTNITLLNEKIIQALDEVRPFLKSDGGDVELIGVKDNIVTIKFLGACSDCSINQSTLKLGVEATIKKYAPQIQEVISITN